MFTPAVIARLPTLKSSLEELPDSGKQDYAIELHFRYAETILEIIDLTTLRITRMEHMHDSPTSLRQFEEAGYVALRQFVHGDELVELSNQVDRFIQQIVPGLPREHVFYEDVNDASTLKQIQHMSQHDSWFHDLWSTGRVRKLAEELLEGPVVPKNLQYFCKPPGIGQPTPPHQDGFYFMLDPCEAVTMWLALDEVDEENGCVRYVRGSHQRGLRDHTRTQTLGFSQGLVDYPTESDLSEEVAVCAQPGDLLAHHALTIHRADGNQSQNRPRRALGFVYFSERAREDNAAQAAYQRRLAEDMKSTGRI
jgi:phytanoyl-CoA hydroxylase